MKKAIVLFSGGLDSTTVLKIAQKQGYECYAISFDYAQRHLQELEAAKKIAGEASVPHKVISIGIGNLGGSALTDPNWEIPEFKGDGKIPTTYVPARNTVFLAIALGWAEVVGAEDIFLGVNAMDYSGYPDCRPEFIHAFETLANLATKTGVEGKHFKIHTPLIHMNKADIIQEGLALGIDFSKTVSCYQADEEGRACGICDSCVLRKKGFLESGQMDTTRYRGLNV